jgi:tRNA(adenine34) deaminase
MEFDVFMKKALDEAKMSLCEGNKGFGAVIVKNGKVIASSHDREVTENDPTSHAEMNAIRAASRILGRDLSGCILVSTHEPCPMCATAIAWAKIQTVVYGYSIKEALLQGRKRIDFRCKEVFQKAEADIIIHEGILKEECSLFYREDVREEIKRLRGADDQKLRALNEDSIQRRTKWFLENRESFDFLSGDLLNSAYQLLLDRFHIGADQAPIVEKTSHRIVFHSMNFCPTLEACKILDLDTRHVCKCINENSTNRLIQGIDKRLEFSRNYDKLRPNSDYCEEMITLLE